jgi:ABC-type transport system substrate-binding protein
MEAKERSVFTKHPTTSRRAAVRRPGDHAWCSDAAVTRAGYITDNFFMWAPRDENDATDMLQKGPKDSVYHKAPSVVGTNTTGIHFQMKNPKFQDIRVRRAFSMALDRVGWDSARYAGEGGGYSILPIPWPYTHATRPTLESQGPYYQFNPAEASALLQAAGYSATNKLSIDAPAWYSRAEYAEIMKPMLAKIPEFDFKYRQVDNPTAVQMLNDRNYEDTMNVTYGPPVYAVDQALYPFYHSTAGLNHNNVNDAEMDRLVTAQRREQNRERQKELWLQAETRILDQVWTVYYPSICFQRIFSTTTCELRPHGTPSAALLLRRRQSALDLARRGCAERSDDAQR